MFFDVIYVDCLRGFLLEGLEVGFLVSVSAVHLLMYYTGIVS